MLSRGAFAFIAAIIGEPGLLRHTCSSSMQPRGGSANGTRQIKAGRRCADPRPASGQQEDRAHKCIDGAIQTARESLRFEPQKYLRTASQFRRITNARRTDNGESPLCAHYHTERNCRVMPIAFRMLPHFQQVSWLSVILSQIYIYLLKQSIQTESPRSDRLPAPRLPAKNNASTVTYAV